jgi:hypothetical protein
VVGDLLLVVAVLLVVTPVLWGVSRFQKAGALPRTLDPLALPDLVRVDLDEVKAIPALAPSLDKVKWSKMKKAYEGRTVVGGVVVYGPQRITWAPDDRSRGLGVGTWQVAWSEVAEATIRPATDTTSAVLVLSLAGGTIELSNIDVAKTEAALDELLHGRPPREDQPDTVAGAQPSAGADEPATIPSEAETQPGGPSAG